jgi:hypothetical protein
MLLVSSFVFDFSKSSPFVLEILGVMFWCFLGFIFLDIIGMRLRANVPRPAPVQTAEMPTVHSLQS